LSSLNIAACIWQGYECAASIGVHSAGAAVIFELSTPHASHLSTSKITTVPVIRNAQNVMAEIINNLNCSAKRTALLNDHVLKIKSSKLLDICAAR
jgi:hypothetical protein